MQCRRFAAVLLAAIAFLAASCAPESDHPEAEGVYYVDLSGLEPWQQRAFVEAAAWWGDSVVADNSSPDKARFEAYQQGWASVFWDYGTHFKIGYNTHDDYKWTDCSSPEPTGDEHDFWFATLHEWGHVRGLDHADEPRWPMAWLSVKCAETGPPE